MYAITKAINIAMNGTRIGRYKKNKKLKSSIESLEENSLQLEVELKKIKEKAKYKVESDTKNYCVEYGSTKNVSEVVNEDLGKVKVLKLTRKYPRSQNVAKNDYAMKSQLITFQKIKIKFR